MVSFHKAIKIYLILNTGCMFFTLVVLWDYFLSSRLKSNKNCGEESPKAIEPPVIMPAKT